MQANTLNSWSFFFLKKGIANIYFCGLWEFIRVEYSRSKGLRSISQKNFKACLWSSVLISFFSFTICFSNSFFSMGNCYHDSNTWNVRTINNHNNEDILNIELFWILHIYLQKIYLLQLFFFFTFYYGMEFFLTFLQKILFQFSRKRCSLKEGELIYIALINFILQFLFIFL